MKYILSGCGEQPINKHILQMERHIYDTDVIGCIQKNIIMWDEDEYGQWFWSDSDIKAIHKDGEKLLNSNNAKKSLRETHKSITRYWRVADKLLDAVEKSSHQQRLTVLYDEYTYVLRRIYAHFITTTGQTTYAIENELKKILEKKFPEQLSDFFEILTTPEKPNILFNELKDWKKIQQKPTQKNILAHTKKYPILLTNIFSKDSALSWGKQRLISKSLSDINDEVLKSVKRRKTIRIKQEEILKKLGSKKAEYLSKLIRDCAIKRLLVKACWNGEGYYLLPFFERLSKMAGCSVRDIYMFYTWREIRDLLHDNNNLPKQELENRKKYYLLRFTNKQIKIYSGQKALKMKKKLLNPSLPNKNTKSFSGTIANKGLAVGRAKLIRVDNPHEINKIAATVKSNHILVSGMTNPTMMVLMKKVSGIITDEGGAACHATIIAREFNLPCLVGCKVATLILQNDQPIILDANHGVVKKITEKELNAFENE